jgi:hypothetical protein
MPQEDRFPHGIYTMLETLDELSKHAHLWRRDILIEVNPEVMDAVMQATHGDVGGREYYHGPGGRIVLIVPER